jgi:DNA-3-methyladenine glycosylase
MTEPLSRDFYARDTLSVARDLLGCSLVHEGPEGRVKGRIVEVEAYEGEDDPACHASAGLTPRTEPLYGPPGRAYVYLIYGMHHCLNAVTRPRGRPSAVLIRALEPEEGLELMRRPQGRAGNGRAHRDLANGPGKLCRSFGLSLEHNRLDLTGRRLWIEAGRPVERVAWTPRVGIRVGTERLWRAFDTDSECVSRTALNRLAGPSPKLETVRHR